MSGQRSEIGPSQHKILEIKYPGINLTQHTLETLLVSSFCNHGCLNGGRYNKTFDPGLYLIVQIQLVLQKSATAVVCTRGTHECHCVMLYRTSTALYDSRLDLPRCRVKTSQTDCLGANTFKIYNTSLASRNTNKHT